MADLEMTKLCAEAIDEPYIGFDAKGHKVYCEYDPLHDDAQAMALVKKFQINIAWYEVNMPRPTFEPTVYMWRKKDLNRAIVECVAKMQAAKKVAA